MKKTWSKPEINLYLGCYCSARYALSRGLYVLGQQRLIRIISDKSCERKRDRKEGRKKERKKCSHMAQRVSRDLRAVPVDFNDPFFLNLSRVRLHEKHGGTEGEQVRANDHRDRKTLCSRLEQSHSPRRERFASRSLSASKYKRQRGCLPVISTRNACGHRLLSTSFCRLRDASESHFTGAIKGSEAVSITICVSGRERENEKERHNRDLSPPTSF